MRRSRWTGHALRVTGGVGSLREPAAPGSPEVAAALVELASAGDFAAASRGLYEALLGAQLLVALRRGEQDGEAALDTGLAAAPDRSGRPRLLAFTGERSFSLGGQPPPFAVGSARGLFAFALRQGVDRVSIDSGGPVSAGLERSELEALADARMPELPNRKLAMRPVAPESVPGLVGSLGDVFAPGSVFLLEEGAGEASLLRVALVDPPPLPPAQIAARVRPHLAHGQALSLMRLSEAEAGELRHAGVRPLP